MARLASTFSALIKEQIDAVERYLARSADDPDDGDIAGLVEPRSAWWSGARNGSAGEVASLALERETLLQLGQLRPEQREEMIAHRRRARGGAAARREAPGRWVRRASSTTPGSSATPSSSSARGSPP